MYSSVLSGERDCGDPDGRQVGEISNWTGKALKIPRKLLKESSSRDEMSKTSVYFLFGQSKTDAELIRLLLSTSY